MLLVDHGATDNRPREVWQHHAWAAEAVADPWPEGQGTGFKGPRCPEGHRKLCWKRLALGKYSLPEWTDQGMSRLHVQKTAIFRVAEGICFGESSFVGFNLNRLQSIS